MRHGYMTGTMSDETQHRGLYQNWKRHMIEPLAMSHAAE
jgi:hypothetical protein